MVAPAAVVCLGEALVGPNAFPGGKVAGTEPSSLYRRTLRAGIVLGAVGLLVLVLTDPFIRNFGALNFNGENGFFVVLTQVYLHAPQVCLTFSAALISAALVMRHIDAAKVNAAPSGRHQPSDDFGA
ncbi:hypothetical protein [Arthrobacter sunyaminii]|uniref:hypothetical protein n=1 Tax=Arthrobacter sunyaminii TaxID=2816859 RepID=UPI001A94EC70|nr:hypothetical protein [Arthrobacter sunyaminii]